MIASTPRQKLGRRDLLGFGKTQPHVVPERSAFVSPRLWRNIARQWSYPSLSRDNSRSGLARG